MTDTSKNHETLKLELPGIGESPGSSSLAKAQSC